MAKINILNKIYASGPLILLYYLSISDIDTKTLKKFNKIVKNHPKLETVLLPIRDGLSLSRKI